MFFLKFISNINKTFPKFKFRDVFKEFETVAESKTNESNFDFNIILKNEYKTITETDAEESHLKTFKSESTHSNDLIALDNKKSNSTFYYDDINQLKSSNTQKLKSIDLSSCSNFDLEHRKLLKSIYELNRKMERTENNIKDQEVKENYKKQWRMMADVIDRVFCIVFFILTFGMLGGIIFQAPNAKLYKFFE